MSNAITVLALLLLAATPLLPPASNAPPQPGGTENQHGGREVHQGNDGGEQQKPAPNAAAITLPAAPETTNQGGNKTSENKKVDSERWWHYQALTAYGTAVGGSAALVVGCLTIYILSLSWRTSQRSVEVANLALYVDRPFLLVTNVRPRRFDMGVGWRQMPVYGYSAKVDLKNFGTGPAEIIDVIARAELLPERKMGLVYREDDGAPIFDAFIGPGEAAPERLDTGNLWMNETDHALMEQWGQIVALGIEARQLVYHGRIRYRGTLERVYVTRFAWTHHGRSTIRWGWDADGNSRT